MFYDDLAPAAMRDAVSSTPAGLACDYSRLSSLTGDVSRNVPSGGERCEAAVFASYEHTNTQCL